MAEELSNLFAIGVHEHLAQLIEEFDHGEGFFGLEMSDDLVKTKGHMGSYWTCCLIKASWVRQ